MLKRWRQLKLWQKIFWLGLIIVWLILLYLAVRPTGIASYRVKDRSGKIIFSTSLDRLKDGLLLAMTL